jgi:hypothetical protein
MYNIIFAPSFFAHIFNGLLLLLAVLLLYNNYSKIKQLDFYKKIILVLLFSIGIGIHGLSHIGLETTYHYNPFQFLDFHN